MKYFDWEEKELKWKVEFELLYQNKRDKKNIIAWFKT